MERFVARRLFKACRTLSNCPNKGSCRISWVLGRFSGSALSIWRTKACCNGHTILLNIVLIKLQIDGLVQERHNSSVLEMEWRLSCTNSSKWYLWWHKTRSKGRLYIVRTSRPTLPTRFNLSFAGNGILSMNFINNMPTDALVTQGARLSAAMVSIAYHKAGRLLPMLIMNFKNLKLFDEWYRIKSMA